MGARIEHNPSGNLTEDKANELARLLVSLAPDLTSVRAVSFFVENDKVSYSLVGERIVNSLDEITGAVHVVGKTDKYDESPFVSAGRAVLALDGGAAEVVR